MENLLWILTALIMVALGYLFMGGKKADIEQEAAASAPPVADPLLARYLDENAPDCRIYIGIPLESAARWTSVNASDGQTITLNTGEVIPVNEVRTFLITNPGGEMLARQGVALALPEDTFFATEPPALGEDILEEKQLHTGDKFVRVSYGPCATADGDDQFYSMTFSNIGPQKVRIVKFARYIREEDHWKLDTTSQGHYPARLFRDWFNLLQTEWLEPGQELTCPEMYGGQGGEVLWAYFIETYSSTKQLVISAVRPAVSTPATESISHSVL